MAGIKPRNSSRSQFKRLEILAFPCEYIFSLMNFIVNNKEHFQTNSAVHSVNTRNKNQLQTNCQPLKFSEKCIIMLASKFSSLPSSLTSLVNKKAQFKAALKKYLSTQSLCSVDEFLMFTNES
jgi:hypothetical protein